MSKFITLEGCGGTGKSTQIKKMTAYLKEKGIDVLVTREPGGTPIGEALRSLVLSGDDATTMLPETELMLMLAARNEHLNTVIIPALKAGKWVLCDRYSDSTYAYQGYGNGVDLARIEVLDAWVSSIRRPDHTILLEASTEVCAGRRSKRAEDTDQFDRRETKFQDRVRQGFLERSALSPGNYTVVNASDKIAVVSKEIFTVLDKLTDGHVVTEKLPTLSDRVKKTPAEKRKLNFIKEAMFIHKEAYTYERVEYVDSKTDVIVSCHKHGAFIVKPNAHLSRRQGCPDCGGTNSHRTEAEFIAMCMERYGDLYTYERVDYQGPSEKVVVTNCFGEYETVTPIGFLKAYKRKSAILRERQGNKLTSLNFLPPRKSV